MWSIVSSMKLLRKPSKRGEGDIERNKGSTVSLKDHSKEASISHLDSDAQVNLDPSCSTDTNACGSVVLNGNIGKSATLGSSGASGSSSTPTSGTKTKVERRESARLASSATKFLRSLRNHSGGGKLTTSSVIAADDKHPINVIALKELDIETHSLNPRAAGSGYSGGSGGSRGPGTSGKLPERSQSFNEKRLLVVTQNTSSENSAGASGTQGNSAQVKVKHSRAQSFVCNNSSNRNKSGYSIYLNQQHQFQSTQQNQANLAKQQQLFVDQSKHQGGVSGGNSDANRNSKQLQHSSAGKNNGGSGNKGDTSKSVTSPEPTSKVSSTPSRAPNVQSCETIYENLEVILEEKQNKEQQMNSHRNGSGIKDYSTPKVGNLSQSGVPASSKCSPSVKPGGERQHDAGGSPPKTIDTTEAVSGNSSKTASSSSESLENNMRISGKDRPCQITRKYNKDSGYETSCSDYSNMMLPKSPSVDSIIGTRMAIDKQYQAAGSGDRGSSGTSETRSNRILNTSLYEELNVSPITEEMQSSAKPHIGSVPSGGGSRKLRRSISEVPSERSTNLAKLQTKVGDSTARAMYTIANGLAVWTTEKSNSSLGLNAGGGHSGSTQTLHQYQNVYGCRANSQLLHPQSVAPIPGGFSAAVQQASVYSTLPRNHTVTSGSSASSDAYGIYRGFQYRNIPAQTLSSQQSVSQTYHNYGQIAAKSTPSLRNAVLQEHHLQQKCFDESTDENKLNSSPSSSTATTNPSSSESQQKQQQQSIYQTIPVPTLSPARSTPNLGSANKLLQLRPDLSQQQHNIQGSIPQLSMVSSGQHQQHTVSTLGKVYQKPQQLQQKLYNHFGSSTCLGQQQQQQSLSSSVVQLQQLQQSNDKTFAEPGRYPSTPNLQKSDSGTSLQSGAVPRDDPGYSDLQTQCNPSESHNFDQSSNSGSTNNLNSKSIAGAMSGSNDSATSTTPSCIGGNWNAIDAHSILSNNNNNINNNNSAPVRDPSSLKQIRYGPGHEKYPSWPIPVSSAQQIDPAGETHPVKLVLGSGSTRSKSWTEQTDYPKEKTPSYARPYMKRVNHSYTQQLKTVMEKCERIPPEAYASQTDPQLLNSHVISHSAGTRHSSPHHHHQQLPMNGGMQKNNEGGIVPPPLLYRDLMANQQNGHHANSNQMSAYNAHHQHNLMQYYQTQGNAQHQQQQQAALAGSKVAGEKEYMIPSPPERVIPEKELSKPLTQEDLELYTKRYEELITQYPQSEGYHSYISSDSSSYISSGTPFLDQLRRESESNQQFWSGDKGLSIAALSGLCDPNDPLFGLMGGQLASAGVSGRESVTTVVTNSSSNSSGTETLKWHGSTSDISLSSGIGGSLHSNSNFKHSSNNHSSRKNVSNMLNKGWSEQQQQNIAHSSRLSTPQKQLANSPDNMPSQNSQHQNGVNSLRSKLEHFNGSPSSLNKWHSGSNDTMDLSGSTKSSNNNSSSNSTSNNNGSSSNNGGNNPPNLKKFPLNTYTRPNNLGMDRTSTPQAGTVSSPGSNSTLSGNSSSSANSTPEKMAKLLQTFSPENSNSVKGSKSLSHSLSSPVIDTSKPPSVAERIMELEQQTHQQSGTSPSTSGTSSPKIGQGQSNDNLAFLTSNFIKSSSLNNLQNSQPGMYMDESSVPSQSQQQTHQQNQNDWMGSAPGNRASTMSPRGFMQSLSSSNVNKVSSSDPASNNAAAMSYSYLDPDKKHKVADMTLKAIQKKALLSYYERHKGKCANASSASSVSSSDGTSSQADGLPEKDMCFSGKSRLMLSLPKDHSAVSSVVDAQQQQLSSDSSRSANGSNANPSSSSSSSPSLSGLNRPYRAISISSGVSSSSSSSRSSSMSNSKVSSHSQHQQLVHGANNNTSPKTIQNSTGLSEDAGKQADKSEMRQTTPSSATPDTEPTDMYPSADSARLAYMSKYLPHLVRGDATSTATPSWSNNGNSKLAPGGSAGNNGSSTPVTQEPAPIPPERPPKKPHLRNLAQQAHDESKDSKPPPPLPRAPVRPPTALNNGATKPGNSSGPPPIPSKPVSSVSGGGGLGITRSPSPDELPPPPPPPPSEDIEVVISDEPLPPPPTVSEVDVLFGSRTRSVTGLSSCLHKDSYMAQRKERTMGYEGRYRRTLSPSGLGSNNNNSKSSLESPSPGASCDSVGSTRSMTNLGGGGKVDSSLSPAAWEKFHNIRPPSTTVIFTSNELAKGASSPTSSTAGSSTSGSPQPPLSQPLFHRSISCDSNIFNNKTGASQSSIPPPVAQVAPLRGSTSVMSNSAVEESIDKLSQLSLRNDVITMCPLSSASSTNSSSPMLTHTTKPCDTDGNTPQPLTPERDNNSSVINSDSSCENDERHYRDSLCQALDRSSKTEVGEQQLKDRGGSGASNFALPSVIVPPLQYEKYEQETRNGGPSVHSHHSFSESSLLKKSELSLRVNCTSVVTLQSDTLNGNVRNQTGYAGMDGLGSVSYPTSNDSAHQINSGVSSTSDGCPTSNKGCNFTPAVNTSNSTASFYTGRQKTQEELECEELSRDIAKQLPQGDKLQTLLVPLPDHKTTADYMEGLFHLELKLQPDTTERRGSQGAGGMMQLEKAASDKSQAQSPVEDSKSTPQTSPCPTEAASQQQKTASDSVHKGGNGGTQHNAQNGLSNRRTEFSLASNGAVSSENSGKSAATAAGSSSPVANSKTHDNQVSNLKTQQNTPPTSYRRCNGHAPLPADSAYFTTSESKAKFLTQYNNDIKKEPITETTDSEELDKQKEELVSRISRKLEILRTEQLLLREEIQSNEQLGQMVVERVKQTAKRNEFDKFKLHVEEIEKITSLLLGISGRLARAENALMGLSDPPNPQEKKILESKRDKLREQLDEAKILKENIDRRSAQVSSFLQKYLTTEEYADYDHFVKMKAKLIIDAREIDDKIKLGEEQLGALKDALNTSLPLPSNNSS